MVFLCFFLLFLSALTVRPVLSDYSTTATILTNNTSLVIIILTQKYEGPSAVKLMLELDYKLKESKHLEFYSFVSTNDDYTDEETKSIVPVLSKVYNDRFASKADWFLIIKLNTIVLNVDNLLFLLSQYPEPKKRPYFLGRGLQDDSPKIIHHFVQPSLMYPLDCSGFVLSNEAMKRISKHVDWFTPSFTIDPLFELSLFLKYMRYPSSSELHPSPPPTHQYGIEMTHLKEFCGGLSYRGNHCVTSCNTEIDTCLVSIDFTNIFFAIKTCQKFHDKRIPIQLKTWATPTSRLKLRYYSDVTDTKYGTLSVGVVNTERGHCTKLLEIFKLVLQLNDKELKWVVVADDDTLLCTSCLMSFLRCQSYNEPLVIGEVYGYNIGTGKGGYLYPTAGSSVLLTIPAVQKIVESGITCPSHDYPDDMFLGMLIKSLQIPLLDKPFFHQDQPQTYHKEYLSLYKSISFHRFSPFDPIQIYKQYLTEKEDTHHNSDTIDSTNKIEL